MKTIGSVKFVLLGIMMLPLPSGSLPSGLLGKWRVGTPYDTPNPVGITAEQEKHIRSVEIVYSPTNLHVCGKDVPIRTVEQKSLTDDQFLQAYGFLPRIIGMEQSPVLDLTINPSDGMNACGDFEDPGVHVLVGRDSHVVIEVANDYLPLKRDGPNR